MSDKSIGNPCGEIHFEPGYARVDDDVVKWDPELHDAAYEAVAAHNEEPEGPKYQYLPQAPHIPLNPSEEEGVIKELNVLVNNYQKIVEERKGGFRNEIVHTMHGPCPDCKEGKIELFTSIVECERCGGVGRIPVEELHDNIDKL